MFRALGSGLTVRVRVGGAGSSQATVKGLGLRVQSPHRQGKNSTHEDQFFSNLASQYLQQNRIPDKTLKRWTRQLKQT